MIIELFFKKAAPAVPLTMADLFSKQEKSLGKSYRDGEIIIHEGDVNRNMYMVQLGEVEVFRAGQNKEKIHLATLKQGDVFGEMSFLDDRPRSASVRAMGQDVRVLTIDARTILRRANEDPFLFLSIFKTLSVRLREMNNELSRLITLHNELSREHLAATKGLSNLAQRFHADESGQPISRWQVSDMATCLADQLRKKFPDQIDPDFIANLGAASALYDVGKGGIEKELLNKQGSLTSEELATIRQHVAIGTSILSRVAEQNENSPYIRMAAEIAEYYQERYDGKGYRGLNWDAIPISARIMSLVDVYHALISDRPYRKKHSSAEAVEIIKRESGTHFDPEVVEAFLVLITPQMSKDRHVPAEETVLLPT